MQRLFSVIVCLATMMAISPIEGARPTPKEAMQMLVEGNARFANDKLEHPNRGQDRRDALIDTQTPFAAVLGCSDSRVSPVLVFDQGVGDLFEIRVAGNVIDPVVLSSIEYAVHHLGASLVFILGHANCGAVKAVLAGQTHEIEPIGVIIESALKQESKTKDASLEEAIKANIRYSVQQLKNDPDIKKLIEEKKLAVAGGYYHLESGKVEICCDVN